MEVGQLAILPASHTEEEAKYIRLLLAPQLLHILICSHLDLSVESGYILEEKKHTWHCQTGPIADTLDIRVVSMEMNA